MPDDLNQSPPPNPVVSPPIADPPAGPLPVPQESKPPLPPVEGIPQPQTPPPLAPLDSPAIETSQTDSFSIPPTPKRKIPRLILGVIVLFLLFASIPAAVFLVQQRQIFQQKAAGEPSASISGPSTGTLEDVAQNGAIQYSVNVNGGSGIWRGELWVAKFEGSNIIPSSSWGCVNWGGQNLGDFCLINRVDFNPPVNAPTSYSGGFGPPQNGTYYVFPVVWGANNTHCTGSPWPAPGEVSCGGNSRITLTVGDGGGGGGAAPTANVSGPTSGAVGAQQGLKYTVSAQAGSGNLTKGEIYIAKTDGTTNASDWGCVQHDQSPPSGIWCRLNRVNLSGTSASFDGTWWPPQNGEYYVATNVFNSNGKQCSNNPFASYPLNNNGVVYENCGSPAIRVNIGGGAAQELSVESLSASPNPSSTMETVTLNVRGKGATIKIYIHGNGTPTENDAVLTTYDPNKLVEKNKFYYVGKVDGANNVIDGSTTFNAPNVGSKYFLVANAFSSDGKLICSWNKFIYDLNKTPPKQNTPCTNASNNYVLEVIGPTAQVTGPVSGGVGQSLNYTANAKASDNNNLLKGELYVAKQDKSIQASSWGCINADGKPASTYGSWCLIKLQDPLSGNQANFSGEWKPTSAGKYYVTTTIFDSGRAQCSGNPFVEYPWVNPQTQVVYGNCGTASLLSVEITGAAAQCLEIKAYDTNWNLLSQSQLSQLTAGNIVRFAVKGQGTIDKARFKINNGAFQETTNKKPGSEEFFIDFTIPQGTLTFSVQAEVHDTIAGWI